MSAAMDDGRNLRRVTNRATALAACRRLMLAGDFRPTISEVAKAARLSVRSVFQYFGSIEVLHREALDAHTEREIAELIYPVGGGDIAELCRRSVHAAVFGTAPALPSSTETRSEHAR